MVGVTEANLTTGQESREERIGNTVERPPGLREAQPEDKLDAACRQIRPALRVASGSPLAASKPSTVVPLRFSGFSYRRSEEHTSELQSQMRISYAVFCLKKKHKSKQHSLT